nr:PEGA domain-containing protein [Polyangium spumosum]
MDGGGNSKKLPIIIGVAAVLLVGGAVGAFIVLGGKDKGTAEDPNAPIAITPTGAPTGSGESAAPAGSGEAPAPPPAAPTEVEVAIKCTPGCDTIKVDDKEITDPATLKLAPGEHMVELSKAGYQTQTENITVEADKKFEKEFKLAEAPKETATTANTTKSGGTTTKTNPTVGTRPTGTKTGKTCTGVGLFKKCK